MRENKFEVAREWTLKAGVFSQARDVNGSLVIATTIDIICVCFWTFDNPLEKLVVMECSFELH